MAKGGGPSCPSLPSLPLIVVTFKAISKMKLFKRNIAMLMAGLLALSSGALVTSCDEDDDYDTNQFKGGVALNAASLKVTRGGYMTFKGSGLDQIQSIEFPGGESATPEKVDEYTIRCKVPMSATEGTVKLIWSGGELETKTIAFTEPIEFGGFSPAEVTPGDELTIEGSYLSYIEYVQFATGENVKVEVNAAAGQSQDITSFKVVVPVDASTGVIGLGYYSVDGKDTLESVIESEEILTVAGPSDLKLSSTTVKAGESLTITGKLLRLVSTVKFEGATAINVAASDPTKDVESIMVKLPAEAVDGAVTLTLLSGLEVKAGEIATAKPTAEIKDKAASYGVGDKVVLSGENLDLITTFAFDGEAEATAVKAAEDGTLTLAVTAAAKTGDITLNLANGTSIAVSGFVTTKPVAAFPESATPLDKLDVKSTLGSRVATVLFGDLEAAATASETGFSVQVPLEAKNGCKVTYVMDNGETGTFAETFDVNSYTFCAISSFKADVTSVGSLLEATVMNAENLDYVTISGEKTEHLLVGTTLYVNVGITPGQIPMVLVSKDKTEVPYTITVQATGIVETIIYSTPVDVNDNWKVNHELMVGVADVPEGATLRLRFTKVGETPAFQIYDGHWGGPVSKCTDEAAQAQLAADGYVWDLDPALFPYNDWGYDFIIQGQDLIMSSVSWVIDYSAPTTIWEGSFDNSGWGGNQDLAWGGYDWSTVKAGQTLYFYVKKVNAGAWGCLSLRHGTNWGALVDANGQDDVADADDTATITFTLTQGAIDDLNANGGLVMTGDNLIVTKVAIK